jgi:hypothetical protein
MPKSPTITFKNMNRAPDGRFYVGYLKGKRKYVEQTERYDTPEEAMAALGLKGEGA